ncbi:MAG: ribulose-phosphate 3-epimerase [Alistipes sp.]|nr:ribulose-phosphate 3-epimerase [Alistipes sp.]
MNILSPSILSADFSRMGEQIKAVEAAGAQYIHIDVMDGMFVPNISYGMPVIKSLRKISDKVFDVHLMVHEPIRFIGAFVESGADLISVHVEACKDVAQTLKEIKKYGKKCAVAINPRTPVEAVMPYLSLVDMILVMSVEPGKGGQKFIEGSLEKVRGVRKILDEAGVTADVEIDGGISGENIRDAVLAGANIIVAGSTIFCGDATERARKFITLMGES